LYIKLVNYQDYTEMHGEPLRLNFEAPCVYFRFHFRLTSTSVHVVPSWLATDGGE